MLARLRVVVAALAARYARGLQAILQPMTIVFAAVSLIFLLTLWRTLLWRPRSLPTIYPQRPLLVGHRGLRSNEPSAPAENSLEAFRRALEAGLHGIECDVQLSSDQQLFLYHDFDLPDGRRATSLPMAQLQAALPQLSSLQDLLELAPHYPQALLNLELKADGWQHWALVWHFTRLLRSSAVADRVLVSSFNPLVLAYVRLLAPQLRTALLYYPKMSAWLRSGLWAGWLHCDALHPHESQIDAATVQHAKARGLMLNTWTVNDSQRVAELVTLGVDAIMADDPQALQDAA